jgi:hypothetical protein
MMIYINGNVHKEVTEGTTQLNKYVIGNFLIAIQNKYRLE